MELTWIGDTLAREWSKLVGGEVMISVTFPQAACQIHGFRALPVCVASIFNWEFARLQGIGTQDCKTVVSFLYRVLP